MSPNDRIRQLFEELVLLLEKYDEPSHAQAATLSAAEGRLDDFLVSNELWGGAGSIADQAVMHSGRGVERRDIERVLIDLGKEQVAQGNVNPRTVSWINAFIEWRKNGI